MENRVTNQYGVAEGLGLGIEQAADDAGDELKRVAQDNLLTPEEIRIAGDLMISAIHAAVCEALLFAQMRLHKASRG